MVTLLLTYLSAAWLVALWVTFHLAEKHNREHAAVEKDRERAAMEAEAERRALEGMEWERRERLGLLRPDERWPDDRRYRGGAR